MNFTVRNMDVPPARITIPQEFVLERLAKEGGGMKLLYRKLQIEVVSLNHTTMFEVFETWGSMLVRNKAGFLLSVLKP